MRLRPAGVVVALVVGLVRPAVSQQDSVAVRHLLWLDPARMRPFTRTYDVIVHSGDSSLVIGERTVSVRPASYAGADAWLIEETRTGAVLSAESLYVATDLRPLHWSSTLGPSRLAAEFVGDSMFGAASAGRWKQNILLLTRPDLVVSASMAEVLLGLLPLTETWSDSVGVLAVNAASTAVVPGELAVVALEEYRRDSVTVISTWVVALRSERSAALYWVDGASGVPVRVQQRLPAHAGRILELRLRWEPTPPG